MMSATTSSKRLRTVVTKLTGLTHGISLVFGAIGVAVMAATVGTGMLLRYVFVQGRRRGLPSWGRGALFIVAVLSTAVVVGLWLLVAGAGSILEPLPGLLLGLIVARLLCGFALRRDLFSDTAPPRAGTA
jgi:uncharacterized membrane-anchored protein